MDLQATVYTVQTFAKDFWMCLHASNDFQVRLKGCTGMSRCE